MITLFRIETFKLFKRKKTLVVLIAFMLLTTLIGYGSYRDVQNYKRNNSPEARITQMESIIESIKQEKNNVPDNLKNDKDAADKYRAQMDEQIQSLQSEITTLKASQDSTIDWKETLRQRIKSNEDRMQEIKNSRDGSSADEMSYLDSDTSLNKYLLEHDIKPVDTAGNFDAFSFITLLVSALGEVFLAIGIAVFAADMVSGEASPPTMKLLLTQPITRGKVIFSKFLSINIASVLCIVGVEIIGFLMIGLFFGFGNSGYPVAVGAQYKFDTTQMMQGGSYPLVVVAGSRYIIPQWEYIIRLILMQSLYIVACTSVVFLISALVKNSMVSMGISVVSVIGTSILFLGYGVFRSLARFVYVIFGNVGNLITGQAALNMRSPGITLGSSIIMFIVWIIVSYITAHIVFTKKDILI
ncbi:MAG: ABC transporter permease subunit [Bacillota bacterium]|nr:ABC transporter permease subunit [Bacillota bacterium]